MKYLSKEELEDIAKELVNNPTRETLKILNDKYNKVESQSFEAPSTSSQEPLKEGVQNTTTPVFNMTENTTELPKEELSIPVSERTIPITSVPETPSMNTNDIIPSLEIPKESIPVQNNTAVNFSGNLWEPQMPSIGNMMETTDNFNTMQNTVPNMNSNNQNIPFFGPRVQEVNNQVPVNGVPKEAPSMFGQIQQNYNGGA